MQRLRVKPDDEWEKQRAKWAGEVGRLVMAFGSIEAATYAAIRHFPRDPIAEPLTDAPLSLRIDLLIAIANGHGDGSWVRFAEVLAEVKQLAAKRNLVAHNGLGYDVYENASGEVFFDEVIRSAKKPRRNGLRPSKTRDNKFQMSFDQLVAHRKEAEALEIELANAMMDLLQDIGHERYVMIEGNHDRVQADTDH